MNEISLIFIYTIPAIFYIFRNILNKSKPMSISILVLFFIIMAYKILENRLFSLPALSSFVISLYVINITQKKEDKRKEALKEIESKKERLEKEYCSLKKDFEEISIEEKKINLLYSIIKLLFENFSLQTIGLNLKEKISSYLGYNEISFFLIYDDNIEKVFGAYEIDDIIKRINHLANDHYLEEKNASIYLFPMEDGISFIFTISGQIKDKEIAKKSLELLSLEIVPAIKRLILFNKVENMSMIDGLTGLYRRGAFNDKIEEEFKRAINFRTSLALIIVDIDHFKSINDKYGHQSGDLVLKRISDILKANVYETDFVARYGGEEFAIIMPRAEVEGAFRKAEFIRNKVAGEIFNIGAEKLKITISMGISHFPRDCNNWKDLISCADKALYYAKENGRNRVIDYSSI